MMRHGLAFIHAHAALPQLATADRTRGIDPAAIRDAMPAAAPGRGEPERSAGGLAEAVQRQIALQASGAGPALLGDIEAIHREVAPDAADGRDVGLAKAVARQLLAQFPQSTAKAAPAIEHVRNLKAGRSGGARSAATPWTPRGRVLAAARR